MTAPCVLALDDEPDVLALITTALEDQGFRVETAGSVADFWLRDAECDVDVYIVDIGLPDGSGFNVVKDLRRTSSAGILVLSGRSSETDHVVGLEIGADDYVTKPFRLRELAARVNAVYRRCLAKSVDGLGVPGSAPGFGVLDSLNSAPPPIDFSFDDFQISLSARRLWGAGMVEIPLTTKEFDLLVIFVKRRGQVLSRDQIMTAIKGREWDSYDRAIDGLVSRLRKKLPPRDNGPQFIRTVHGTGYCFVG